MEYCIQIENGAAVGRPIAITEKQDGLVYAPCVFSIAPQLGPYETDQTVTYQNVNGEYVSVWSCRTMTPEEQQQKQDTIQETWASNNCYQSWVFDKNICAFEAPAPYPNDGKKYRWDEPTTSWTGVQ